MKVISICNQKGGCAKTTSTLNISAELARNGKKVLMIDADYQGHLTTSVGLGEDNYTLLDCFEGNVSLKEIIKKCEIIDGLDIIPCNERYSDFSSGYENIDENHILLKKHIYESELDYDYIVIDCSPSLDLSVSNNLVISDKIIVPIEAQLFSVKGLGRLMKIVRLIKAKHNPKLEIAGILITRVDNRTTLGKETRNDLSEIFSKELFDIEISQSSVVPRSQLAGLPLCLYDPKSKVAKQYEEIAKEIIKWD